MTDVTYCDAAGCGVKLRYIDGRNLIPAHTPEQWKGLVEFKTKPDDVFICSYPKSGFHWLWEITTMIRRKDATPVKDILENNIIDFVYGDRMAEFENREAPRTFTTHRYPCELPTTALEQQCKIVYLVRDPRDICVSYYHHIAEVKDMGYDGQFNDFVQLFLEGKVPFNSWSDHIKLWCEFRTRHPGSPLHIIFYEDMKKEPLKEISRLASFLEVDISEDLVSNIAENTAFPVMKKQKESLNNPFVFLFKSGKDFMYRKGKPGDWKNWFTVTRSEELQEYIKAELEDVPYENLVEAGRYSCLQ